MKNLLFLLSIMLLALPVQAGTITREVQKQPEKTSIGNTKAIPPEDVIAAQSAYQRQIQYMLDNYSDAELRNYTKAINNAEIQAAKLRGNPVPATLGYDTLHNREKMGKYLRSLQRYKY